MYIIFRNSSLCSLSPSTKYVNTLSELYLEAVSNVKLKHRFNKKWEKCIIV